MISTGYQQWRRTITDDHLHTSSHEQHGSRLLETTPFHCSARALCFSIHSVVIVGFYRILLRPQSWLSWASYGNFFSVRLCTNFHLRSIQPPMTVAGSIRRSHILPIPVLLTNKSFYSIIISFKKKGIIGKERKSLAKALLTNVSLTCGSFPSGQAFALESAQLRWNTVSTVTTWIRRRTNVLNLCAVRSREAGSTNRWNEEHHQRSQI